MVWRYSPYLRNECRSVSLSRINEFMKIDYNGWILLEARTTPTDRIAAMKEQLSIFNDLTLKL